jgi:hypothetical protein
VSHVDPEVLTLIALGEEAGGPDARAHLARCAHCADELRALASVVHLSRQAEDAGGLVSPPAAVWGRIVAHPDVQTGHDPAADGNDDPEPEPGGSAAGRPRGWGARRRSAVAAVAGVLAGLIIGACAAAIAHIGHQEAPVTQVVGTSALRPLPQFPQWQTAGGSAIWSAAQAACSST